MSRLELRRVSKVYGQGTAGVHALADASLPVDAGSMVAVMGPSGSGKRASHRDGTSGSDARARDSG